MKKYLLFFLAAVIGSAITIFSFHYFKKENIVQVQHVNENHSLNSSLLNDNKEAYNGFPDFRDVSKKVMHAVVHINSTRIKSFKQYDSYPDIFRDFFDDEFLRKFFGPDYESKQQPQKNEPRVTISNGSGVIISQDGYVVTNNHVVESADDIEITLNDNRVYKAQVIGVDPSTDLALLKIDDKNLPFIPILNSDEVEVGEWVIAVGNPFNLNSTVTAGIVSAKARNINILQGRSAIESFIQTDAAINPGNSGGALVNLKGGLIGINTAIASPTGTYAGYGFAIPSNIVNKVVKDLIEFGIVQRGFLGLVIKNVDGNLAKEEELDVTEGVYVDSIPDNSAAGDAGVRKGDVILSVNNSKVKSTAELLEIIAGHRPGDEVLLAIDRKGKEKVVKVILRNKEGKTKLAEKEVVKILDILGIEVEAVSSKISRKLDIEGGVRITSIKPGKIRDNTAIKVGFIITKIDGKPVSSADDIIKYLENKKGGVMLEGMYEGYAGVYYYAFGM